MISDWKYWKWDFSLPSWRYWLPESQCAQRVFHLLVYFAMDDRDVKRRKVTRECIICREDKGFRAFPGRITEACQHVRDICRSCMKQTIKTEIQSKGQSAAIRCPNCAAELSLADVARESSTADAEQLDTFLLQKALSQEPNFVWCAHGCGIGQLVDDLSCNAFMTCQSCGRRTCNHHRTIWHDELSCAEHDRNLQSKQEWQPSFKLDNCTLRSSSRGILYRKSASMQDTINACVLWGTTVRGWPFNDRWIAVGEFFLPTHLRNVRVIQPLVETYQAGWGQNGKAQQVWMLWYCQGVKQHEAVVSFYVLSILNILTTFIT